MSNFLTITGSTAATTGIAVMSIDGSICCIDSYTSTAMWNTSTPQAKPAAASAAMVCGNNTNGLAAASGTVVNYLTSLGNDSASWKSTVALADGTISAVAGDNVNGFTVLSSTGKIYQLSVFDGKTQWKVLSATLPFDGPVKMLAGDNKGGILVIGGHHNDQLGKLAADCCTCTALPQAPFSISMICGDVTNGFVAFGEGQLQSLDAAKGAWLPLQRPNFPIVAMSGSLKNGVVALVGGGDVVAYCTDPTKSPWSIAMIPKAVKTVG